MKNITNNVREDEQVSLLHLFEFDMYDFENNFVETLRFTDHDIFVNDGTNEYTPLSITFDRLNEDASMQSDSINISLDNVSGAITAKALASEWRNNKAIIRRVVYRPASETDNLIIDPSDFSSEYALTNLSIESDNNISPDGTLTASKLAANTNNSFHVIQQLDTELDTTKTYTFSVYVKQSTNTNIMPFLIVSSDTTTNKFQALFDMQTKTFLLQSENGAGDLINADYDELENGWFRIWITGKPNSEEDEGLLFSSRLSFYDKQTESGEFSGSEGDELYTWGWLLEQADYPTDLMAYEYGIGGNLDTYPKLNLTSLSKDNFILFEGIIDSFNATENTLSGNLTTLFTNWNKKYPERTFNQDEFVSIIETMTDEILWGRT